MTLWNVISNAGDGAVALPLAALCACWVSWADKRLAWRWILILAVGLALVGITKILHAGCGTELESIGLRMISGHTTQASAIWTTLLGLFAHARTRRVMPGAIAGLLIGALIGMARVFEHAHTVSEVIAGWLLGGLIAMIFLRQFERDQPVLPRPMLALIAAIIIFAVFYGHNAPFEAMINAHSQGLCPGV